MGGEGRYVKNIIYVIFKELIKSIYTHKQNTNLQVKGTNKYNLFIFNKYKLTMCIMVLPVIQALGWVEQRGDDKLDARLGYKERPCWNKKKSKIRFKYFKVI